MIWQNFNIQKSSDTCMDGVEDILGANRLEDVTWLCSLSESELDMLISLKIMLIQRAKVIGHESLAENFDLKMLRALGMSFSIGLIFLSFLIFHVTVVRNKRY
ncbi:hypothetical protein I3843_10G106800 [Carya illinoinensis]|nr:hypothetical protein I3843_10G106800 [Carya illinoinensis]